MILNVFTLNCTICIRPVILFIKQARGFDGERNNECTKCPKEQNIEWLKLKSRPKQ